MEEQPFENQYYTALKIILLGEVFTGKTSLINVYIKEKFNKDVETTTSPSYFSKLITVDGKNILINMWDTAGQEQFRSMNKIFIKNSNIILFIYDITRKKTLTELNFWSKYVESCIEKDSAIYGIIGNKIDLFDAEEELKKKSDEIVFVNTEEGKQFADQFGAYFLETSAKEGAPGFVKFIDKLVAEYMKIHMMENKENEDLVHLVRDSAASIKKSKCC